MKNFIAGLFVLGFTLNGWSQSDAVLMKIAGEDITKGEFEYLFYKNNDAKDITMKDVNDYLDLYTKFKLKVIEAENRKMDTTKAFIDELNGYRDQLAKPYLTNRDVDEFYLKQAYNRLKEEVETSHILIEIKEPKAPEDTLAAYNKALEVYEKAMNGENFTELARRYSVDPSAAENGGYLGFFKGFQMVYPFEDAAYNTPVGSISKPVRTSFGYHIIKVHSRRPSQGEVKVAHIMKAANEDATKEEKSKSEEEIYQIYSMLKKGGDFNVLAKENSDDFASAENGGELVWFSTGMMVKPFESAAFRLKNVGDISEPIKTQFGWHIIKLLDKRDLQPFDELKDKISARLLRDPRGGKAHETFIKNLERDYNITVHQENIDTFIHISHLYTYRDSMFKVATRGLNRPVLTIDGVDFSQEHFADYLISDPRGEVPSEKLRVERKWARYYDKTIVDYENSVLEKKYPDFRYLMKEYHDGILLFEISSKEIWNKASEDTAGLEKFYDKFKKNYRWDEPHYNGRIVYCASDSVAGVVKSLIADKLPESEILSEVNKLGPNVNFVHGIYTKGENDVVDHFLYGGSAYKPYMVFDFAFLDGKAYEPGAIKELDACRGAVTSEYQNYLEQKWVDALKKKYKVKVDKKVLKSIVSDK